MQRPRRFPRVATITASILLLVGSIVGIADRCQGADEMQRCRLPKESTGPPDNPSTPDKIELGKLLFFDPRLSGDNKLSCASCHRPDKAFTDSAPLAVANDRHKLPRNTPSLLNIGFFPTFFWDGRAASLEEQALIPITSADEMNQDPSELDRELAAVPGYVDRFQSVFGSKPTKDNVAKALAAFERTLLTGPSPFDKHLAGDRDALSDEAKRGMELFFGDAGCVRCHNGPLLSDGKFYRLGVGLADEGRRKITGEAADRRKFRTPSLRNVAQTAPYMHDGSMPTLTDVVEFYYRGVPTVTESDLKPDVESLQGRSFSEVSALVEFLESLTGEPPQIIAPALP